MSKEDFKCSVEPIDPKKVEEEWRFNSIINAVKNANEMCKNIGVSELVEEDISFSAGECGGSFAITLEDRTYIKINVNIFGDDDEMYDVELFGEPESYDKYIGGVSCSRLRGKIDKDTMGRKEPFSDEENEKFINKPIKLIQDFLEKQKGLEK